MKTFKLNLLSVLKSENNTFKEYPIELIDGLIINREDEEGQWLVEVYCDKKYREFFLGLEEQSESVMINVKITKETNASVGFDTSIVGSNDIGDCMNVLFLGKMIDKDKRFAENLLRGLITEGHQGEELLERFKNLM